MKTSYMDRDTTGAIKGIALILMFVHHFFTFPSWLISGIEYPELSSFADAYCLPTQLCVPVFAFLTGYFYNFTSKKTYRYSIRKITDILVSYWFVYLPFLIVAVLLGCYTFTISGFVYELFGLTTPIMSFCWYIYFYCIVMLALPLLTKVDTNSPVADTMILLVAPTAVFSILIQSNIEGLLYSVIYNVRLWLPCVSSGYLFAKYSLFERFFERNIVRIQSKTAKLLICFLMVWVAFRGRYFIRGIYLGSIDFRSGKYDLMYTMDILYAPLFIYGTTNLLRYIKDNIVCKLLVNIGKHSMLMWFIHCIFFNVCKEKTQGILYFPKNPILVTINGLILCYLASALIDPLLKRTLKFKNQLLNAMIGRDM